MSTSLTAGYDFDWSDLAFGDKKPLRSLKATFIMAPREISAARFVQLVKQYLPQGPIVLGLAKEDYIDGFAGQPQFKTLHQANLQPVIDKVNRSASPHKIYSLRYFQREVDTIIAKLKFKHVLLVNGSWRYAFHNRSTYYLLANNHLGFELISPFTDAEEAKAYDVALWPQLLAATSLPEPSAKSSFDEAAMLDIAARAARLSYDYSFQTGVALGKAQAAQAKSGTYALLAWSYNHVVPYQTYAMHHGASRERNFSPPHDLNHYDTVHAEVELVLKAQRENISFDGATMFINLLPCPACARMLSRSDIGEFVYREDHSNGYAVQILEAAGKLVRRNVS